MNPHTAEAQIPEPTTVPIDTLLHSRWLIPVLPRQTLLEDHCIAIHQGKIVDILPSAEASGRYRAKQNHQLDQHVLTPGLVNAHGHAAMSLFRGMADDTPLQVWLEQHIWPAEAQWVSESFVHDGTQLAIAEMLRSGTTCFSDMYFFPNVAAQAAHDAGIRSQIAFPVFEFASAWGQGADDYIHKGLQVRDDFKYSDIIDVVFGPHAPYTVEDQALQTVATLAAELDINIQIHLHETAQEIEDSLKNTGKRPLQRIFDLGLLTPRTQCVHMTSLNSDDLSLLEQSGAHVVHCPESNLKLASGLCPVQQLLDLGINVALGTDGAASNNDLDMFGEMRTAALLAKVVAGNASALNDWQALEMATLGGAKALGIDNRVGSIEIGKEADLIAIDLSGIEQQPIYQPVSQLAYGNCAPCVSHSWIAGQQVMNDRHLTTLNTHELIEKAQSWRDKINAQR